MGNKGKKLFKETREDHFKQILTIREAAKSFGLFDELEKIKKEELTFEQQEAQRYYDDNNIGLRIKELIKRFNEYKDTQK